MKISVRLPYAVYAWICARSENQPSKGLREAAEEIYKLKTSPQARARDALLESLPKGPPPTPEMAHKLYQRWLPVTARGVDDANQLTLVHSWMVHAGWIPGPADLRRAKPWTKERARLVLDAMRGMHTARQVIR